MPTGEAIMQRSAGIPLLCVLLASCATAPGEHRSTALTPEQAPQTSGLEEPDELAVPAAISSPDIGFVRVVDVGAGLCVIIVSPEGRRMIYDAGHWNNAHCLNAVEEEFGVGGEIDLFVLSHGDGDHVGNADKILDRHPVQTIIWTGDARSSGAWRRAAEAIGQAGAQGTIVYNLQEWGIPVGTYFELGSMRLAFLAGWAESPWSTGLSQAERHNAISIVMRLEYGQNSVLLTGDMIGRSGRAPYEDRQCDYAERYLVDNQTIAPLGTEVLIAPHHGGNNGSTWCLIEAVSPTSVVFSAGHLHGHPREAVVRRYLATGVASSNVYRTDVGDDEGEEEWDQGRIPGCSDKAGDDDIEIWLPGDAPAVVNYRVESEEC